MRQYFLFTIFLISSTTAFVAEKLEFSRDEHYHRELIPDSYRNEGIFVEYPACVAGYLGLTVGAM